MLFSADVMNQRDSRFDPRESEVSAPACQSGTHTQQRCHVESEAVHIDTSTGYL